MGVVNVTPDSFSDGGLYLDSDAAVAHGLELVAAGADLLDIGGESTRPGAEPVSAVDERARVVPVIERLAAVGVPISVDTSKAEVAAAALGAGATVVNDVTAGRGDPQMLDVAAAAGAGFVAMHMRGEPRTMQRDVHYADVVAEVVDFLAQRVAAARDAGIDLGSLCVDPGIGFGKHAQHNLALLGATRCVHRLVRRPGPRRDVAQGVPRCAARPGRGRGRRRVDSTRRARRRHARDRDVGDRPWRVDRAGARRRARGRWRPALGRRCARSTPKRSHEGPIVKGGL